MNRYFKTVALLLLALMFFGIFACENTSAHAEDYAIGSYVTFGTYPQSADGGDETPIEWLVLDCDGDKALLLSRYALDVQLYNEENTDITWENCTLRTWLNDDFLNHAFSVEEQSAIIMTNIDNSSSQGYSEWNTSGGNDTQDRVFLLSYAEANRYLGVTWDDANNTQSRVAPTAYAEAQGAYIGSTQTADGEAVGFWWLRSPGSIQVAASSVDYDGSLVDFYVDYDCSCVRPTLWVSLESEIF